MNSREHLRTSLNSPRLNAFAVLTYCASLIGPLQLPLIVKAQATNSCSSSNPVLLDTVIVGAGGTGLFAGYTLRRNGYDNFQILEASSKVGGRIQDLPSDFSGDALRLDLGPAFAFNGLEPLREVLDLRDDEEWVTESVLYDPEDGERCEIRTDGQVTCSDIDEPSVIEEVFSDGTFFSYLETYVIPQVQDKVILNDAVTTVDYSEGSNRVTICTANGIAYQAQSVVMAVPLAILQDGDIEFIPPLPSLYQNTIDAIPIIGGMRFWVEFSERFYPDALEVAREDTFGTYYLDAVFGETSFSTTSRTGRTTRSYVAYFRMIRLE